MAEKIYIRNAKGEVELLMEQRADDELLQKLTGAQLNPDDKRLWILILEKVVEFLKEQPRDDPEVPAEEVVPDPGQLDRECLCGCGETTSRGSRFRPKGHDMKLKRSLNHARDDRIRDCDRDRLAYAAMRCRANPALSCHEYDSDLIIELAKK